MALCSSVQSANCSQAREAERINAKRIKRIEDYELLSFLAFRWRTNWKGCRDAVDMFVLIKWKGAWESDLVLYRLLNCCRLLSQMKEGWSSCPPTVTAIRFVHVSVRPHRTIFTDRIDSRIDWWSLHEKYYRRLCAKILFGFSPLFPAILLSDLFDC